MNASSAIYFVDDDATNRGTIKSIFKSAGYSSVVFSDGAGLLEAARRRKPISIVLDVRIRPRPQVARRFVAAAQAAARKRCFGPTFH